MSSQAEFRSGKLGHMLGALILCVLGVVPMLAAKAQQPVPLHDGQQIVLHGTLSIRPAGRLQFVTIRTTQAYVPVLTSENGTDDLAGPIHEIGLSGYNSYHLLYAHRGQPVTVLGKVMTDGASPYYLHNASLAATSIRLADGTELTGRPRTESRIAVDVGLYQATAVLPADPAQPWQYSAHGSPDPEQRFLSCSSNGGGDVVNCSCAKGFKALRAESSTRAVTAQVFDDSYTAQFGVGDEARRVELSVTCSR